MMQELAMGLAGGKEKTDQTPSFVRAVAKVERSVVIAAVIIRPCFWVTYTGQEGRERDP